MHLVFTTLSQSEQMQPRKSDPALFNVVHIEGNKLLKVLQIVEELWKKSGPTYVYLISIFRIFFIFFLSWQRCIWSMLPISFDDIFASSSWL